MKELTRLDLALLNAVRRGRASVSVYKKRPNLRVRWIRKQTTSSRALMVLGDLMDMGLIALGPAKLVAASRNHDYRLTPLGVRFIAARLKKQEAA